MTARPPVALPPTFSLSDDMKSLLLLLVAACGAWAAESALVVTNATEFGKIVPPGAAVEKLAGDMKFIEGPVWLPRDGGFLVFSDIPANQLKKWTPAGGVTVFREPSGNANGNTLDRQGRLVTAEHGGRCVGRTESDGTVRALVERYRGKKLNSPNDVVVKSDGTVWFTDPPYGIKPGEKEQPANYVFCYDPGSDSLRAVADDFDRPNGLCFSPDEKWLYIADSGQPRHIRVFAVRPDNTLTGGEVFCKIDPGAPDGIRCDADGRIWSSAGDGVQVFAPNGALIGKILTPEVPANLCFGGANGRTLFITARTSLYCIPTLVTGGGRM